MGCDQCGRPHIQEQGDDGKMATPTVQHRGWHYSEYTKPVEQPSEHPEAVGWGHDLNGKHELEPTGTITRRLPTPGDDN